jgi:hypothetical protein
VSATSMACVLCDEPMTAAEAAEAPMCDDCLSRCYFCGQHCAADPCEQRRENEAEQAELERLRALEPPTRCYGRWHWRRWRLTAWVFGRLYWLGITATGGSSGNHCAEPGALRDDCLGHPGWGFWVHRGPGWRALDPRKGRVYVLGIRTEWLALLPYCLRNGHWPLWLEGMGCGKCAPWPCCGAVGYDHAEGCSDG